MKIRESINKCLNFINNYQAKNKIIKDEYENISPQYQDLNEELNELNEKKEEKIKNQHLIEKSSKELNDKINQILLKKEENFIYEKKRLYNLENMNYYFDKIKSIKLKLDNLEKNKLQNDNNQEKNQTELNTKRLELREKNINLKKQLINLQMNIKNSNEEENNKLIKENKKNNMMDVYLKRLMKNKKSKKENFKNSSSEKEILQSTLEISKTKKTFSNLSNIDKFFQDKKKNDNNCFQFENIETSEKSYFKKLKKKKKSISKKLSIDEEKPINKFIKLFPSYFEKRLNGNTSNTKKIILKFISPLEKLYNKVSKSENKLKFNKKIKHYLKNRGLNISDHLSRKEFYDTFEQSNKNVFKKNLIYNDILLRKKNDNSSDFTEEQIKKIERDKNIKKILTDSQNQIIKMYCDYNYE